MAHYVVYVPGLADRLVRRIIQATSLRLWRVFYGIRVHYFIVGWADMHESFEQKLQRLLNRIDDLIAKGHTVSLVSVSAGASLAMVAFQARPKLNSAISICGKLQNPQLIGESLYVTNPAFKGSMARFGAIEAQLTPERRKHILHVQPLSDAWVPVGDNLVQGAVVTKIPTKGHILSIFAALTFFSARIVRFIHGATKN